MTTLDVEAAVSRAKQSLAEYDRGHMWAISPNVVRAILASHAALVERGRLDGEALGLICSGEFPEFCNGNSNDLIARANWQTARARLQAREGGGS